MSASFDLQGHRGARGLRPENTFPSFEIALDCLVASIETDVLLTRDGVIVVHHDCRLSHVCRPAAGADSRGLVKPLVRAATLAELRQWVADVNPDPVCF